VTTTRDSTGRDTTGRDTTGRARRRAPLAAAVAAPLDAAAFFAAKLRYETDCADVHASLAAGDEGFVVIDARTPEAYAQGHVPGAVSLPHADITPATAAVALQGRPAATTVFVTYCWGPHCNGATRAAANLAALGLHVKEMIGGVAGWQAEGYALAAGANPKSPPEPGPSPRPA
jgi:rhodanese-related sulfurtransferase